jgi:hypothetical protein
MKKVFVLWLVAASCYSQTVMVPNWEKCPKGTSLWVEVILKHQSLCYYSYLYENDSVIDVDSVCFKAERKRVFENKRVRLILRDTHIEMHDKYIDLKINLYRKNE